MVLSTWDENGTATFIIKINPMMSWLWVGSIMVVIGSIFAIWNGRYQNVTPKYTGVMKEVA